MSNSTSVARRSPWSFVAIAFPIAAYIFLLLKRTSDPGNMAEGLKVILVLGVGSIAGFTAACIAAFRKEKPVALVVLGFVASLFPVIVVLFSLATHG